MARGATQAPEQSKAGNSDETTPLVGRARSGTGLGARKSFYGSASLRRRLEDTAAERSDIIERDYTRLMHTLRYYFHKARCPSNAKVH